MELAAAFGKSNLPSNDVVLMANTTSNKPHIFQGNSVQFAESSTWTYGINANMAENSTVGLKFIPLQRIVNYGDYHSDIEDTSASGIFAASFLNTSSAEEMTETHIFSLYSSLSGVPRYDLVAFLENSSLSAQIMQG